MVKKIPLRTCVATLELLPKKELLRIVKTKEGQVFVDLTGKMNGRGAYLKKTLEALEIAKKKSALNRALETTISDEVYEKIAEIIQR